MLQGHIQRGSRHCSGWRYAAGSVTRLSSAQECRAARRPASCHPRHASCPNPGLTGNPQHCPARPPAFPGGTGLLQGPASPSSFPSGPCSCGSRACLPSGRMKKPVGNVGRAGGLSLQGLGSLSSTECLGGSSFPFPSVLSPSPTSRLAARPQLLPACCTASPARTHGFLLFSITSSCTGSSPSPRHLPCGML